MDVLVICRVEYSVLLTCLLQGESDGDRHDHLLSAIAALKGNRKRKAGHRSEVTPTVSEYHLPQQEGTGEEVASCP